jgi:hypothetical protein
MLSIIGGDQLHIARLKKEASRPLQKGVQD